MDAAAGKSSQKVDLGLVEQVVVLALEARVGLLLNLEDNIAWHDTGHLVTLAAELDLVAITYTLVNVNVEHLALHNGLLAVTLLAAVLLADDLTLAIAVGADSLEALDHGTHLAHHGLHTAAIAACARLDGAILTATTFAAGTDDGLLQGQLRDLATVDIFQVNLMHVVNGASLLRASVAHATAEHATEAAAAAEELREQVLGVHTTGAATTFQTLLTILVVDLTLLRVRQNLVGVRQFLELLRGIGVVRVLVCTGAKASRVS